MKRRNMQTLFVGLNIFEKIVLNSHFEIAAYNDIISSVINPALQNSKSFFSFYQASFLPPTFF